MATQTHLDHETRLGQIVAAARDLIAGGGVDALTVRGIASKVGVTEAAIYRHVTSKEEVLILLLEEVSASLFSAITEATSEDRGALEQLRHLLQLHFSYTELRKGISFIVIAEAAQFQEPRVRAAGRKLVQKYHELVECIVERGIRRGEIDPAISSKAAATMFFGMVQGSVTRWLLDPAGHPLNENQTALWTLFRSALAPAAMMESAEAAS
jgi:TetR/AcrR family fatty acid metabolism transcriptional regulator